MSSECTPTHKHQFYLKRSLKGPNHHPLQFVLVHASRVEVELVDLHVKICKEQEVNSVPVLSNIVLCATEIDGCRSLTAKQH